MIGQRAQVPNQLKFRPSNLVLVLGSVLAMIAALFLTAPSLGGAATPATAQPAGPVFGRNVMIFDPSMETSYIQGVVDAIRDRQINDEMGTNRYALLFKPGTYGSAAKPLIIQVGYYTEVAGLGLNPTDVTINGHVDVYNRCRPESGCIALNNFWRAMSNLTINVMGGEGCRRLGQLLGRLAGLTDAPGQRHRRQPHPDGLLHCRSAVRQRRLHRRLEDRFRHQRVPAAVHRAQQQRRWLVERGLEPGVLRRRWRPGRVLPRTSHLRPVHDAGRDPGEPGEALPVHRLRGEVQRLRPGRDHQLLRSLVGERPDTRTIDPAVGVLRGQALRLGPGHQQPALPRHEPAPHARRV